METFFDSSGFFAWADEASVAGEKIRVLLVERRPSLVTTSMVFAETISLLTKRVGKHKGIEMGERILESDIIRLVYLDEGIQRDAWQLCKKYKDKDFDFIDAASFVFCQKQGIKEALTLDRHFSQMGFKVYPE